DMAQIAAAVTPLVGEIVKRQACRERRLVDDPMSLVDAAQRQLPQRLAEIVVAAQPGGIGAEVAMTHEAELLVLYPVPAGRQCQQIAHQRVAVVQRPAHRPTPPAGRIWLNFMATRRAVSGRGLSIAR